ncbi:DUF3024 domain-containing protein [Kribbella sp. NPDC026611]|uniref:DUF3024 domain-containing protein n=1 Tax=Kribbella sp. NPDC026611 TaxID=3154911 RepID=UPI0033DFA1AA
MALQYAARTAFEHSPERGVKRRDDTRPAHPPALGLRRRPASTTRNIGHLAPSVTTPAGPQSPFGLAPRHLTIVERHAPWREDHAPEWTSVPVARLRYTAAGKSWTLYWRDRHLRFHHHDQLAPSQTIDDLLAELDRDPTCMLWG